VSTPTQIPITQARQLALTIGLQRGLPAADAAYLADDCLAAELCGVRTHGLLKFLALDRALANRLGQPIIDQDFGAVVRIDAQRQLGPLAARFAIETLQTRLAQNPFCLLAMRNVGRYGRLAGYGQQLAEAGFIGILSNQGGLAIAPPGAHQPQLGANPLCFAFPRANEKPLVIDFSTSHGVWSEVLLAKAEGRPLAEGLFCDRDGNPTRDPAAAYSLRPFGGGKGFALALALELLCGALTGANMSTSVGNEYEQGVLFIGLRPNTFGAEGFAQAVADLSDQIRQVPLSDGGGYAHLPGDSGLAARQQHEQAGTITIDPALWQQLSALVAGDQP
jgi:LDH2 family malate/lactate/ureidoglycolate dehydrogenase